MDSLSSAIALKALDGLSRRAEVTADNIANASTPGYRPRQVSFEQALVTAAARGRGAVDAVRPETGPLTGVTASQGVRLDQELATAASTQARYAALVEVLNRQLQIRALATGGR